MTPNKKIRYPLPGEPGSGDIGMETMARDLDASFTVADTNRAANMQRPSCSQYRAAASGPQSIAKATGVALTATVLGWATGTLSGFPIFNDRIVAATTGLYYAEASVQLAGGSAGTFTTSEINISRNGAPGASNYVRGKFGPSFSGTQNLRAFGFFRLAAADYLTCVTFWSGSGAGPTNASNFAFKVYLIST
jgi:hypothetical protein